MRTNEVEKITGLTKHAILYYEKVGIIRPKEQIMVTVTQP
ncbi:MAG: MerR family transcriptional regulator [Thomasclavelia ramosa]